jgi:hypothetical protein
LQSLAALGKIAPQAESARLNFSLEFSMRAVFPWLAFLALSIAVFVHYGNRLPDLKKLALSHPSKASDSTDNNDNNNDDNKGRDSSQAAVPLSDKPATIVSPLQTLMDGSTSEKPPEHVALRKPSAKDLIAPSPVGTGGVILHKTFPVVSAANFAFEIPAHAATPHLRGHYQSFTRENGTQSADDSTDIAFLLMNQDQYSDFINHRPAGALFSLDSSHNQDVNFSLPASQNQPAKFYLVFRNDLAQSKKIVQADFTLDF